MQHVSKTSILQAEHLEIFFLLGQCPARAHLLDSRASVSGAGALALTLAAEEATISIDNFPYCIGEDPLPRAKTFISTCQLLQKH